PGEPGQRELLAEVERWIPEIDAAVLSAKETSEPFEARKTDRRTLDRSMHAHEKHVGPLVHEQRVQGAAATHVRAILRDAHPRRGVEGVSRPQRTEWLGIDGVEVLGDLHGKLSRSVGKEWSKGTVPGQPYTVSARSIHAVLE